MVQIFRPPVIRKLKSSLEIENLAKQKNASYHQPTITYLLYKNTVTSPRNEPVRNSHLLCNRYKHTINPEKKIYHMLPKVSNDILEDRAKSVRMNFQKNKNETMSILTLKALGIRKITSDNEENSKLERRKSYLLISSSAREDRRTSSTEKENVDQNEVDTEVDYLYVNQDQENADKNTKSPMTENMSRKNSFYRQNSVSRPNSHGKSAKAGRLGANSANLINNPDEYTSVYVNNQIINKPRTYHITSLLSRDAQYSMIKVYEDMMRRRLKILYPQRIQTAPDISMEAFYGLCSDSMEQMSELTREFKHQELIENKIKKMSNFVEEGIQLLDFIDEHLLDYEKTDSFEETNNDKRNSICSQSRGSSISAMGRGDPLTLYIRWVNAFNKEYNKKEYM